MYWTLTANQRDQTMIYQKTNLSLHVSISSTRWILKFSIHGNFEEFVVLTWYMVLIQLGNIPSYLCFDKYRCNILKRVPNSALWLLRFPAAGEMRLRNCILSWYLENFIPLWCATHARKICNQYILTCFGMSRCCATGCATRSDYFHRCCHEKWTYQTQCSSRSLPWHVNILDLSFSLELANGKLFFFSLSLSLLLIFLSFCFVNLMRNEIYGAQLMEMMFRFCSV